MNFLTFMVIEHVITMIFNKLTCPGDNKTSIYLLSWFSKDIGGGGVWLVPCLQ